MRLSSEHVFNAMTRDTNAYIVKFLGQVNCSVLIESTYYSTAYKLGGFI